MGELVNLQIAKKESVATKLFESLIPEQSFLTINYDTPKEYAEKYWRAFSLSGKPAYQNIIFEHIIRTLLYREKIYPFYYHARIADVPLIQQDILFISNSIPISLTIKTSLRERYKQADLEAIALKYVHRKARSFLLTMNSQEAKSIKAKIPQGEVIGLDDVIDCNTDQLDDLIVLLKQMSFCESTQIDVVTGNLVK